MKNPSILRSIIIFTTLFFLAQILFSIINFSVNGLMDAFSEVVSTKASIFFQHLFIPLVGFVFAQVILYAVYIYFLWYLVISISELFSLTFFNSYLFCFCAWLNSVITILALNTYFAPHSFFSNAIRLHLLHDALTDKQLKLILITTLLINASFICLAIINLCYSFYKRLHLVRHCSMVIFICALTIFALPNIEQKNNTNIVASKERPNIFIIGFDAMRPDHLSFFDKTRTPTPHFDNILNSAIVFPTTYVALARTMPSWVSLLTASYPLHNDIRENCLDIRYNKASATLPQALKNAGYQTIYATDDRRYVNIDEHLGFDQVIGPGGEAGDYLLGTINDFPLANLVSPTPWGKFLFPYNHGNRSSAHTYNPDNFLELINTTLSKSAEKPLFFAVHFTLSGFPFHWYNDHQAYNVKNVPAYNQAILSSDVILANFLKLLEQNKLLEHAIVILISDHGITLGAPGDRVTAENLFQGNKNAMKLRRSRYTTQEQSLADLKRFITDNKQGLIIPNEFLPVIFASKNYGIDTSFGYGGDVLSLKQHQALLAFKFYGMASGKPHSVSGPSLMLDVAPTLLDILNLPPLKNNDGISLKPYLVNATRSIPTQRKIFLESGYSVNEMEQEDLLISRILAKSLPYYNIDPTTGRVTIFKPVMKVLIEDKQRAILQGDLLLAYYPKSQRYEFSAKANNVTKNLELGIKKHLVPPFFVLVNMKTGEWTTDVKQPLVKNSPLKMLRKELQDFYGNEMDFYSRGI